MKRLSVLLLVLCLTPVSAQQQDLTPLFTKMDELNAIVDQLRPPTVVIAAGENLQLALDLAQPGTVIELEQSTTYVGNFVLRNKSGNAPITLRTKGLVLPDGRISPSETRLAKLQCQDCSVPTLQAEPGAHDVMLTGIQFLGNPQFNDRTVIRFGLTVDLGTGSPAQFYTAYSQAVRNITLDRVLIMADPQIGGRLGVLLDGINMTLIDSQVSGFWKSGQDSQAVGLIQGPGPTLIENTYLEASGENFMAGGADPKIHGAIPSDITFRRNHVAKPLAWKTKPGSVKNLFELKNARRVLIEGNLFEHNWPDAQAGFAIVFTVRNQDGNCPWCTVEDVDFRNNVVRNVQGGVFNILGQDYTHPSQITKRITIANTLFLSVQNGGQIIAPIDGLTMIHNTVLGVTTRFFGLSAPASAPSAVITGFILRDNLAQGGAYGIAGDSTTPGTPSLEKFAPGYSMTHNVIENPAPSENRNITYPAGNTKVAYGAFLPRFDSHSVYTPGAGEVSSDGLPLGVDLTALRALVTW